MKSFILSLFLACCFCGSLTAQNSFFDSKNAYLGQRRPNDTPRIFAQQMLLPDSGMAVDRSAFSANGKEFYYCNAMHWFSSKGNKIRYFKYESNKWRGPFVLNYGYYAPTFSIDGKSMYFAGKGDGKHAIAWISHRNKTGWTNPVAFLKMDYGLYDLMPTRSGTFYVGSNAGKGNMNDFSKYDFCTLAITKTDTVVKSLGPVINTPAFDGDFYVAPDESYMIISYKEKLDFECELGITFRKPDHSWTVPQNLGPLINDGDAHRWGEYVTPDGKFLFYTKGTGEKDCHLYWVRFDTLKAKLKKEALGK
jgi:YHS domain-containing protein